MTTTRWAATVTTLGAVHVFGASALSQPPTVEIPSTVSCTECRLELERVVTIGRGEALLGVFSFAVAHDGRGRFFAPTFDLRTVVVFDSLGEEIRTFGRAGEGPGELRGAVDIKIGPGDSLYVFDFGKRVSVFSPSLVFARSFVHIGDFASAALLPTGGFIAETRRGVLVEYGRDGNEVAEHTILPNYEVATRTCGKCDIRALSPGRAPGTFWTVIRNRYQIDEVGLPGAVRRRFVRRARFFEPWTVQAPSLVPQPLGSSVREDSAGRLWTIIQVADPKWNESSGPADIKSAEDYHRILDSMVEVFDPASGRLVASQRFPRMLWSLSDGLIASLRDDREGRVLIDVWRMKLIIRAR